MTRILPQPTRAEQPEPVSQPVTQTQSQHTATSSRNARIHDVVNKYRPQLAPYEDTYKYIHSHPCLSFLEDDTAELVRTRLAAYKSPAFTIKTKIGKTGLVGILRNGEGPTVLLRADMDALPVEELTGLDYASKKQMKDRFGKVQPVMHACGHDMHVTTLLAATDLLYHARHEWSGTLISCFQQAEEAGGGAQGMIDDGMYDPDRHNVPKPDIVLGGHVMSGRTGTVTTRQGVVGAANDSLGITIHGRGGHASEPESTRDPIVMAAAAIMRLQTIVSREIAPQEAAVLSIAQFRAGSAVNIIPDTAYFTTNVRSFNDETRATVDRSIRRIVKGEAEAGGAPGPPTIEQLSTFPITHNDERITAEVQGAFAHYFGDAYAPMAKPMAGSEDFATLGTAIDRPTCFWIYGGHDAADYDERQRKGTLDEIPSNHSARFAPVIQPTLRTGTDALAVAALHWLLARS